ncbi:MAG: pantoate--beta-alanine ligase [Cytophagales bacterium]|nr:pantoate--beta-alanine ligase [Cytophagales bacterium]MDW8385156.1 pantoate--beta-alanine ligase [Flammeovirgaceae bacterium]
MLIFHRVQDLIKALQNLRDHSIGFVPTMGALHEGHLSLIRASKQENDCTVCSIYVNPTQFNNSEDLIKYPRNIEKDCQLLQSENCDILFAPTDAEMYPQGFHAELIKIHFGTIETILEGAYRPGHFQGVGLIISKLFNIIHPTRAYFGLKDLQQCFIIKKLVSDLSYRIELRFCPTVREKDGLAMSSRNALLSDEARQLAPQIYQTLLQVQKALEQGYSTQGAIHFGKHFLLQQKEFQLEYLEIVNFETFEFLESVQKNTKIAICLAAWLKNVRLIDNLVFELR